MQVILDSLFAHPGSAPIWGGKKGEFRDWTNKWLTEAFRRHKKDTFIVAFQRKTAIVFVGNLNPYRLLFQPLMVHVHFGYQRLRYFEPEHVALVKMGSKRVYVSVSVKHSCTRFYGISR